MNNKIKPFLVVIIVLGIFVILNETVVNVLANTSSFLRKDNQVDLIKETYEGRIEELEKDLLEYERVLNELKIYDKTSMVLAKTALRNIYDMYDYIVVNTSTLVKEGDIVLNERGLVGIVSEIDRTTAKVELLTKGIKISVKVGDNYGIMDEYDKEKGEFIVHNIDNYKEVVNGSKVVTSGFQNIKADVPIGEVVYVENKGIEKVIRVKPFVDFDNLNYLMIEAK